ncbi:MAG: patatin-like phospholipase family protein [Thermomicrobiales bacterium]
MDIKKVRIGVALSSGGARGFAHVGVLKALLEAGLDVVQVAGSSMGSIMAAGYAIRGDIAELEQRVLAFRARDHTRRGLPIMNPARITAFLDDILGGAVFTDCAVPLAIVATDLERRTTTTLTDGPVALATFASMAMPFVHRPVPWEGRLLAEGSLSCVLPLRQARATGVDLVIGSLVSKERPRLNGLMAGVAQSAGRAIRGWQRSYVDFFRARPGQQDAPGERGDDNGAPPAVIVTPRLDRIGQFDFRKMREAIAAGEEAVAAKLGEITAVLGRD